MDVEVAEGPDMEEVDIGDITSVVEAVMGGGNPRVLTELSLHSVGVLRVFCSGPTRRILWKNTIFLNTHECLRM